MAIEKNDFVEVEFDGYIVQTGELFDSTNPENAEALGMNKENVRPFVLCVGKGMTLKGFDEALIGKEVGREYEIGIDANGGFGERQKDLVQMVPLRHFDEEQARKLAPGMQVYFQDGSAARVIHVGGGRVLLDFNHPLAGKDLRYKVRIKKKIEDEKEKIDALQDFFFKRIFGFEKKDGKIVFEFPEGHEATFKVPLEILNREFGDVLGVKFEAVYTLKATKP